MALIFITTCNHFVFFPPLQVKNERINKEIKAARRVREEPRAIRALQVLVTEVSLSDQGSNRK